MPRPGAAVTTAAADLAPPDAEARESARLAGLRYTGDDRPGIRRERRGDGFAYRRPDGRPVDDAEELLRIRHLAIPPAWTRVWICADERGHLQATGRDARGRKQYRYHPRWREVRDEVKYGRMLDFGAALPGIRAAVSRDLARGDLSRECVLAAIVRLLDITRIRVGNEEYARANRSYGLTTLRSRHAEVHGGRLRLEFRGKSGKEHRVEVSDRRVARIVARCQDLPGQELFQYVDDDGTRHSISSDDVNDYLRGVSGADFTAKDFRTWAGTVLAAEELRRLGPADGEREGRRLVTAAVGAVARELGNTPAVCRRCYVHPDVVAAHADGSLLRLRIRAGGGAVADRLRPEEAAVLRLLRSRVSRPARRTARRSSRAEGNSGGGG